MKFHPRKRQSGLLSGFHYQWCFHLVVYWAFNSDAGGHESPVEKFTQYQAAYWIEKALSVDNLFVFILVFGYFKVPKYLHHKVLFWGILGALIFRAIFIFAGCRYYKSYLLASNGIFSVKQCKSMLYLVLFGIFLIYAGIKSWGGGNNEDDEDYSDSPGAKLVKKFFKVSDTYDGNKFFTVKQWG